MPPRHRKLRGRAANRGGAAVVRGRRRRLTASSPVPEARKPTAWTCGPTGRAPQRSIPSRTRACLNSRRAMISPTRSAIGSPAPIRRCATCYSASRLRRTRRFQPGRRPAPTASRRQGIDPRSDRLRFPRCVARLARQTFEMRHRQALLVVGSRQVRVAGIARTDRVGFGPRAVRSPGVQTALGIDRRRDPVDSAIAIEFASPAHWEVACPARHRPQAFPSLCWVRAEGRGQEPPRVQSDRNATTGPVE